ncbi:MAG: hypothetical protein ACLSD6_01600 [Clostridium sp.]
MKGLTAKIKAVEKHAIVTELGTAVFVGSSQMILKLGATVALVGGVLLARELDILTFFMFLMVVSKFMTQCRFLCKIWRSYCFRCSE